MVQTPIVKIDQEQEMITLTGDTYNQAQLKNQGRLEKEHWFNTVFYQGIPRSQIVAWQIDPTYLPDLELLAGPKAPPLEKVQKNLKTALFQGCSLQELLSSGAI